MIFKSKYFIFIVFICILFSITAVSADSMSNQTVLEVDTDLQSDIDLNHGDLGDGQSQYSFRDLDHDIKNCSGTLNMEHDYVCSEELESFEVFVNDSLVINGNGHCLDAANFNSMIFIDADEAGVGGNNISVAIKDVTFKNFPNSALYLCKGKTTLNNVSFINVSGSSKVSTSIYVDSNAQLILNNSNIYCSYGNTFIGVMYSRVTILNSNFFGKNSFAPLINQGRGQLFIENSTFENFRAKNGAIISYKGDHFSIKNSKFNLVETLI